MTGALWLLLALAALLALAILMLITPVKVGLTVRTSPSWHLKVTARLLAGLMPPLSIHQSGRRQRRRTERTPKSKKVAKGADRAVTRTVRAIAASPELLTGLLRPIHFERLSVDADIGLNDPADTGRLVGLLAALNHSRPNTSAISIAVRPNFTGSRASGELDAVVRFVPVALIPPALRFGWRVFGPSS